LAFSAFLEGFFEGVAIVFDWWVVLADDSIWNEIQRVMKRKWWKKEKQ